MKRTLSTDSTMATYAEKRPLLCSPPTGKLWLLRKQFQAHTHWMSSLYLTPPGFVVSGGVVEGCNGNKVEQSLWMDFLSVTGEE